MRVLIEPSSYHLQNSGDNAMLCVCASRIVDRFGEVGFDIATVAPDRLRQVVPTAVPATSYVESRDRLIGARPRSGNRLHSRIERLIDRHLRRRVETTFPQQSSRLRQRRVERSPIYGRLCQSLSQYDLVVATGGGFITDCHSKQANRVLWTLHMAQTCGVPTALFGQGIGPISRGPLACIAADVLSKAHLVGLREGVRGPDRLSAWNVDTDRVEVTGDDAIELAAQFAKESAGEDIGLNVRVSNYAGVSAADADHISQVVADFAGRRNADVRPVFVTSNPGEADQAALRMTGPIERRDDEGDDVEALARSVGECRVVVTGSYHAAVFALAQGIPAIGIAASDYYLHKFEGLAGQFGPGCIVYRHHQSGREDLSKTIESLWQAAPQLRQSLRQAAAAQIACSKALYDRLLDIPLRRPVSAYSEHSACL